MAAVTSAAFDAAAAPQSAAGVDKVVGLAREAKELEGQIAKIAELMKAAMDRFNEIKVKDLPDAMKEIGLREFSTEADDEDRYLFISVGDFVAGSLPNKDKEPDARAKAIQYLEADEDRAALIKTVLEVEFSKGQHNVAADWAQKIREDGYPVSLDAGVHASTLQAFARECLRNGDELDLAVLGLFHGTTAKITDKKLKGKKPKKAKPI